VKDIPGMNKMAIIAGVRANPSSLIVKEIETSPLRYGMSVKKYGIYGIIA
jgi:hypothetical protein